MDDEKIHIKTERLELKSIRLSDAASFLAYRSHPDICLYQGWRPQTMEDVQQFILRMMDQAPNVPLTWYQVGIYSGAKGTLVGDIGIHFLEDEQAEIGYTLALEHQGMGYATEGVKGVLDYLFYNLKKHRVTASVDPLNTRSIALLERIGMRKEAHFSKSLWLHGVWCDDVVYAVLEEEWMKSGIDHAG